MLHLSAAHSVFTTVERTTDIHGIGSQSVSRHDLNATAVLQQIYNWSGSPQPVILLSFRCVSDQLKSKVMAQATRVLICELTLKLITR